MEALISPRERYLRDVLGIDPTRITFGPVPEVEAAPSLQVVVVIPSFDSESPLRNRILHACGLQNVQVESELENPASAKHVVAFVGDSPFGRVERGSIVWWNLPRLSAMEGEGVEVQSLKRETWELLKTFREELEGGSR